MTTLTLHSASKKLLQREQEAPLYIVGADLGNETALIADQGGVLQIPSYVGSGSLSDLLVSRSAVGGNGKLDNTEYAIEHQGTTYFVGDLALSQSSDATSARANTGRYTDGHTLRLLMTLAATLFPGDARLRLVTGIPPSVMKDTPAIKQDIPQALVGTYHYTYHSSRGSRQVVLVIESVVAMMEGVPAMYVHSTPSKPIGLIDIGGHSFDVAFLDRHGKIVDTRTRSLIGQAVARAGEILSEQFRKRHGRGLKANEINDAYTAFLARESLTVYHRGAIELTPDMTGLAFAQVAEAQMAFLSKYWADGDQHQIGADAERVLIIGGGGLMFPPYLRIATQVIIPDNPFEENARSYQIFAERIEARQSWPRIEG